MEVDAQNVGEPYSMGSQRLKSSRNDSSQGAGLHVDSMVNAFTGDKRDSVPRERHRCPEHILFPPSFFSISKIKYTHSDQDTKVGCM